MNECCYIHCCHDHPGFDSCKECNHTIEHKLLVWTRTTVYCLQRVFHLTSKHFEVVLKCDHCNRGHLDKVNQSHHRKKNTFQESWLRANQQLVKKRKTKENKKRQKIKILLANVFQDSKKLHKTMFLYSKLYI